MLASDAQERKDTPMARGLLDYFPDALAEVAHVSKIGNDQHNPGQPMHWAKEKSTDHADCIIRHLVDRGKPDTDGIRHAAKVAWRALALLQTEIEDEQEAPVSKVTFEYNNPAIEALEWIEEKQPLYADSDKNPAITLDYSHGVMNMLRAKVAQLESEIRTLKANAPFPRHPDATKVAGFAKPPYYGEFEDELGRRYQ